MPAARFPIRYLAIDLGASSGRAVLASFDGARLSLQEIHRFPNGPLELPTGLHWDAPGLLAQVKQGISLAARAAPTLDGIGVDTWGVDYGLLSPAGELLSLPYHYRDHRTRGLMDEAVGLTSRDRLYARTGIQFLPFNTLYQLRADQRSPRRPLDSAARLLFIPDLLNFWLTARPLADMPTEQTIASTSQLFDTEELIWAEDVIDTFSLPRRILPPVVAPGTAIGPLAAAIARETAAGPVPILAPASHDTASAVVAIPAATVTSDWAYISSGTWSLVGRELAGPLRTPAALAANFTNECGAANTTRFQKNVAGLWLLQECQRHWASRGVHYTHDQLHTLALTAPPLASLVDPDHPSLAEFAEMPGRIREFCVRTGQPPPESDGAIARCILESVALKCAAAIETLQQLTGVIRTIHLIGGGAQNTLLCQFTADAAARPVLAGPVEATAAGNAMIQALAQGHVASLAEIRAVIAASFQPIVYEPRHTTAWVQARQLLGRIERA